MSDSPNSKGQGEESTPATSTRSDIWHNDGSIVIQAGNTLFRVHLSVLALHSQVFHDMQELPQPSQSDQPTVQGCPVIELQDDPADITYLLKALYSPTFLRQKAIPLSVVSALLRLGRKYDFRELLEVAIELLEFENPTNLADYDALLSPEGLYKGTTRILSHPGIRYDMLTLARENGIMSALPCAYYRATTLKRLESLVDGLPRQDETTAVLAPIDLRRCLVAFEKLIKVQFQEGYVFDVLHTWQPDEDCQNLHGTRPCAQQHTRVLRTYTSYNLGPGVLMPVPVVHKAFLQYLCQPCRDRTQKLVVAGREKAWAELPSYFDLPPWDELKNEV